MAHFAELDSNNIVKRVIVVSDKDNTDENGVENESSGIDFCQTLFGSNTIWKQTSYNNRIRKTFAGTGMIYDESLDMFIIQKPFESWTLDSSGDWNPPIEKPELTEDQIGYYQWNETAYQSDNTTGWEFIDTSDISSN